MVPRRSVFPRLRSRIIRAILPAILLCAHPSILSAQSTQGAFLGTVRDASGGAVGAAEVVIKSVAEGVSRVFLTDASGNYYAPDFTLSKLVRNFAKISCSKSAPLTSKYL